MSAGPGAEDRVRIWLDAPADASLVSVWEEGDVGRAFGAYYANLLRHMRVNPAEALRAVERLAQRDRRLLTPVDRARWTRLRAHALTHTGRFREAAWLFPAPLERVTINRCMTGACSGVSATDCARRATGRRCAQLSQRLRRR